MEGGWEPIDSLVQSTKQIPCFSVNIDEPASSRWEPVFKHFRKKLGALLDNLCGDGKELWAVWMNRIRATGITSDQAINNLSETNEVKAIADFLGISGETVSALQFIFECVAFSSTAHPDVQQVVPIGPTLDWAKIYLSPLLVFIRFINHSGDLLFTSLTWAGYLGVLSGRSPGSYCVSVEFRTKLRIRHYIPDFEPSEVDILNDPKYKALKAQTPKSTSEELVEKTEKLLRTQEEEEQRRLKFFEFRKETWKATLGGLGVGWLVRHVLTAHRRHDAATDAMAFYQSVIFPHTRVETDGTTIKVYWV
eukprot:Rmarinus@m.14127